MLNKWDGRFSVGIAALDEQHKKLFDLLGALLASLGAPEEVGMIHKTFNGLLDYVDYHFKLEEDLMASCRYPDEESHKKEHYGFIMKLHSYSAMVEYGSLPPARDLVDFLTEWLENHILKVDKKLASFLLHEGVSVIHPS